MKTNMKTIKERPIIMTGESVRAILDGRKTQTRRTVKPQPEQWRSDVPGCGDIGGLAWKGRLFETDTCPGSPPNHAERLEDVCPHGKPGDRLWVRETFKDHTPFMPGIEPGETHVMYRADDPRPEDILWASPLFMPRWASRLTLEITEVRVQRLHDISESDAIAEGLKSVQGPLHTSMWEYSGSFGGQFADPVSAYQFSWDRINGKKHPWSSNPWVWAVTFKRAETEALQ